ncbi:MAG TPA: NADH-quinone oxidoreductase subunit J [bacterium]|nr:NADH-quinone oxidoreductase subunit J [Candidatus Omnitrophota bacterium]HOJ59932.1 NADH-quinone oxidoreductase subunit J [bacterium]HOL96178.1 NADH-quinone oxidoreductase subunit J [bacterium]HPO99500.1 NADH-quinone oxidoreductase subunit J [bacterium]HXK94177.1 NADH-quinone oxidoreductase subunit J [bacterium]
MGDLLHSLIFYVVAVIVLASAAFTAFASNLVHAAFSLLFTFFGVACLYLLLGADFVGISQVLIYVGGILVLLLFGVMFTSNLAGVAVKQVLQFRWGIAFLVLSLLALLPMIYITPWPVSPNPETKALESTISAIGEFLLTKYLLPFEIASLLLLVALIGAVVIARGEPKSRPEG